MEEGGQPQVPQGPHLDQEGLICFQRAIGMGKCYLEYGTGGSTIYAGNVAKVENIISVETDRAWLDAVAQGIQGGGSKVRLVHCDLGETGAWGWPKTNERMGDFWRYPTVAWSVAAQNRLSPDTILIDGRFRVACFLFSLLNAQDGTTILFDDYFDRPQYAVAERFCRVESQHGRLAVFRAERGYSLPALTAAFAQFSLVPI